MYTGDYSDENIVAPAPFGYKLHVADPVFLPHDSRTHHLYIVGQTGVGKSTLLKNLMAHDFEQSTGLAFIDPHGDTAEWLLNHIPEWRLKNSEVVYWNVADSDFPIGYNPLYNVPEQERHAAVEGIITSLRHIFAAQWSESRMEYLLTNTIAALIEAEGATLLGVRRMLTDEGYRKSVRRTIRNPEVRTFWFDEYPKWPDRYRSEATPPILNRVCRLFLNPLLRNILGQHKSAFDLGTLMNNNGILIVNLAEGLIGQQSANLIGSFLISRFYQAAMARASAAHRPQFHLYVDEFTNFAAAESFSRILSGARKFGLGLTVAHQYIEQMPEAVRSAVFGTVGTLVSFRCSEYDAEFLERAMPHPSRDERLIDLENYHVRIKRLAGGESLPAETLITYAPPSPQEAHGLAYFVSEWTRAKYATPRADAEREIAATWYPQNQNFDIRFD